MTGEATRRAVLAAFGDEERPAGDAVGVELVEWPFQGYHNLRCDPADSEIAEAAAGALGTSLPTEPNRVVEGAGVIVYWLGPDEWLLRTPSEEDRSLVDELQGRLADHWHALTDLSSGMTHVSVSGDAAIDVLSQGTTLDIHPRVFSSGQCAQTVMVHANVLLAPAGDDGRAFDVFVRRSFADHLLTFLRDAAHERGYRFSRQA